MKKRKCKNYKFGYSLMEIIIALGIFVIASTVINLLMIQALDDTFSSSKRVKGLHLAREGVEVVRNIRDIDFDLLVDGTYGIVRNVDVWEFTDHADIIDGFARLIQISSVDADAKLITSTVNWVTIPNRDQSVDFSILLTDWKQTGMDRGDIYVDVSEVLLLSSTKLSGMTMENSAPSLRTLSAIQVDWVGSGVLYEILIDNNHVYLVPQEEGSSSGSIINITNLDIPASHEVGVEFIFDSLNPDSKLLISYIFNDNSRRYVNVEL